MTMHLDAPQTVRSGEELNLERLIPYLKQRVPGLDGPLTVQQFPSGHSNLTYLVRGPLRELVLRRPPFGSKVQGAHDMNREFNVLAHLHDHFPAAPQPVLYCPDDAVIGSPFYVMERVMGVVLRAKAPADFAWSADEVRRCCEAFVDCLVELHGLDYEAAGLGELRKPGQYVQRQVEGWLRRYDGSQTDEIHAIEDVAAWLRERIPQDTGAVVVHNDFKFDNIVLDPENPSNIVGVLDWEMTTVGDPLADLGTSLSYWIEPGDALELHGVQCFLTLMPGAFSRAEVARVYGERSGRDTSQILFYYVLGLLKLAVIVQQIYYRYAKGLTTDERFAPMIHMVRLLAHKAVAAIDKESIEP
jgi:aminoglycoside phosphotransferase (APT) family kinase protein